MKKLLTLAALFAALTLLAAGCGSSSGSESRTQATLTQEVAPHATYQLQWMDQTIAGLWFVDPDVWDLGAPKSAAKGRGLSGLARRAALEKTVSPLAVNVPIVDYEEDSYCGDGFLTVNGTLSIIDATHRSIDVTVVLSGYETCVDTTLTGTINIKATWDTDNDTFVDNLTLDDLSSVITSDGSEMILNGTVKLEGDNLADFYKTTLNATIAQGDAALRFSNFIVTSYEDNYPEVVTTIDGAYSYEGEWVTVETVEDILVPNVESDLKPTMGVFTINGKGEVTVIFGEAEGTPTIELQLDGNEDGDYADVVDWESGVLTYDEFYALME